MRNVRYSRAVGAIAALVLLAAPVAVASSAFADDVSAQSTATVFNANQLRKAWKDPNITLITLGTDIDLGAGLNDAGAPVCGDGEPVRTIGQLQRRHRRRRAGHVRHHPDVQGPTGVPRRRRGRDRHPPGPHALHRWQWQRQRRRSPQRWPRQRRELQREWQPGVQRRYVRQRRPATCRRRTAATRVTAAASTPARSSMSPRPLRS